MPSSGHRPRLGTTLAPGDSAPVRVVLDKRLPSGPWKARLTLRSGLIKRTVTATLTFPAAAGSMGLPIRLSSSQLRSGLLVGFAPAALVLFVLIRRYLPSKRKR